jgi:hypothetical protein
MSSALYLARASKEETVFCTRPRRRGLEEGHIPRRMHMGDRKERMDVGHTPDRRKEVFYVYTVGVLVGTVHGDDLGGNRLGL